ncbi:hypothetical protein KIPB_013280 [Kipferlia bialata]|uniref:Uncharacterized protein n=1 Tax=Kipferlia bialata TaxID=797122 RepID=A0A9K3GQ54_9EUKA|nr:hypothetical protein KIPB_013280 [Kipferlia bialata]|eukprot:g13280.t1
MPSDLAPGSKGVPKGCTISFLSDDVPSPDTVNLVGPVGDLLRGMCVPDLDVATTAVEALGDKSPSLSSTSCICHHNHM